MRLSIISALFILVTALSAQAGPDRASLLLGSRHVGATGFNETNPGVFLTWETDRLDWSVGVFRNSYNRTSVAATAYLPVVQWVDGNAGFFAGLAHYPGDGRRFLAHLGNDIVPISGLQLRHRNLFLQFTPMDGRPVKALVSFGVTWSLN